MFKRYVFFVLLSVLPTLATAHKANYFPPELFELAKTKINEEMQKLYESDAPLADIAFMQKWQIDEAARFAGLPDYDSINSIVSSQILCSWEEELKAKSIRVVTCLDFTCETCSEPRAKFYEYLKTKVWMSEWGISSSLNRLKR